MRRPAGGRPAAAVRRSLAAVVLAVAALIGPPPARAGDLPDWVAEAVARPTPAWVAREPIVTLLDEESVTVPHSGAIRTVTRGVLRVLSAAGRERAGCSAPFLRGSSEVTELRAWVVEPDGRVTRLGRGDAVDLSLAGEYTLYSEARALQLAAREPRIGTVFAWEYVRREEPLVAQWKWFFRLDEPSLLSRISLTLPEGLEPAATPFAADSMAVSRRDRTWTWEMRDLRPAPREPLAPGAWSARAAVMLGVKAAGPRSAAGLSFADWSEVARWVDGLAAPQARVEDGIAERGAALTAGLADTLERIRALARGVQALNYVAVDLGLGRGGGYRPHAAAEVLRLGYGDCKDKANLLCALLGAAGLQGWLLLVDSDSRDRVDERWPSPHQFDHCIVAIRVPRGTRLPGAFEHPGFGTLVAFDPTDPLTTFGDLPHPEQGALGLLVAAGSGGLVRLPVMSPADDRLERRLEAALDAEGNLSVRLLERSVGQQAVEERALRRRLSEADYRLVLESWLAGAGGSVDLRRFRTEEDTLAGRFRLEAEYDAPRFARSAQRRLVFRAALLSPRTSFALADSARTQPIALESRCFAESVTVKLPEGYAVDELPAALHEHHDFAELDADWKVEEGTLRFTQLWTVRPLTLPASRYAEVRRVFAASLAASQSPVVLVGR